MGRLCSLAVMGRLYSLAVMGRLYSLAVAVIGMMVSLAVAAVMAMMRRWWVVVGIAGGRGAIGRLSSWVAWPSGCPRVRRVWGVSGVRRSRARR